MRSDAAGATDATPGPDAGAARLRVAGRLAAAAAVGLIAANCAQQKTASGGRTVDPRYGVAASPRVVGENDPVPKGGGREMVGRPYVVAGRTYVPRETPDYARVGTASWYGSAFHGRLTANGEVFDRHSIAAAHPTMPLPSYARVTNLDNNRSIIVRVNDRGPYHGKRIVDVSQRAAEALAFKHMGTAKVRLEYVGRASTAGSDDRILMATLRTDGMPAALPGQRPTMIAEAPQRAAPLAFRDAEVPAQALPRAPLPSASPAPALAAPPAPVVVAAARAPLVGAPLVNVPVPPERPFDLGPAPARGAVASVLPPSRPAYAALFYAEPTGPRARFARLDPKADPFAGMRPQGFVPLRDGSRAP